MNFIPRIQGRVGQIDGGPDNDKWAFEIFIGAIGEGEPEKLTTHGPFETEELAKAALMEGVKLCCEIYEREFTGSVSGTYIDLKDNERKPWVKQ